MTIAVDEPVSVTLMYNQHQHKTVPIELIWHNQHYPITEVGLHHTYQEGETLKHVFSVMSRDTFFEIMFNACDLTWRLQKSDTTHS